MADLKQKLAEPEIIVMDGATGTQLQKLGLPPGMAPELWNLQNPDAIKTHYRAYVEAGSDAILTNSFGGTRPRLVLEQSEHLTQAVNVAAAELAREVAGDAVLVLGSVGPTGVLMDPMGEMTYDQAVDYFAEQVAALVQGRVDGIHIETMSDLREAQAAVQAAQQVTDLPVTVTMSFDTHGRTMMGVTPAEAVQALWGSGVLAVGVNCGRSLEDNLVALTAMRSAIPEATLVAKPNAGMPRLEGIGEAIYDVTPEIMADYALKFADQHVKMLGGCCGSNPEHITAMKAALTGYVAPSLAQVLAQNLAATPPVNGSDHPKRRGRRRERA